MKLYKRILVVFALLCVALLFMAEDSCDSANTKESRVVDTQQQVFVDNQPAPVFNFSLERFVMAQLYKARNEAVATYSFTQSAYTGKITWSCPSVGFPIPGGTQLTNPEKYVYNGVTLPQAEPNGLYSPSTSEGTWVMCTDKLGNIVPEYVEEKVHTALLPYHDVNGMAVPVEGKLPSLKISIPKK